MRTVHKYKIHLANDHTVCLLPPEACVVRFAGQHGELFMWAELDTTATAQGRRFQVIGTGHEVPGGAVHRGSCAMGEALVWHLYELPG